MFAVLRQHLNVTADWLDDVVNSNVDDVISAITGEKCLTADADADADAVSVVHYLSQIYQLQTNNWPWTVNTIVSVSVRIYMY